MTSFPFQSPQEKPFAPNTRANGEPLDYEQWRQHTIEALHGFNFGPNVGPLVLPGLVSDMGHLVRIGEELNSFGWKSKIWIGPDMYHLALYINHPLDPLYSD